METVSGVNKNEVSCPFCLCAQSMISGTDLAYGDTDREGEGIMCCPHRVAAEEQPTQGHQLSAKYPPSLLRLDHQSYLRAEQRLTLALGCCSLSGIGIKYGFLSSTIRKLSWPVCARAPSIPLSAVLSHSKPLSVQLMLGTAFEGIKRKKKAEMQKFIQLMSRSCHAPA
eukprot:1853417-Rhodomonas_salina.4